MVQPKKRTFAEVWKEINLRSSGDGNLPVLPAQSPISDVQIPPEHSRTHQPDEKFNLTSASIEHTRSIRCCISIMAILIDAVHIAGMSSYPTHSADPPPYLCDPDVIDLQGDALDMEKGR